MQPPASPSPTRVDVKAVKGLRYDLYGFDGESLATDLGRPGRAIVLWHLKHTTRSFFGKKHTHMKGADGAELACSCFLISVFKIK